jgi:hypothetical protein
VNPVTMGIARPVSNVTAKFAVRSLVTWSKHGLQCKLQTVLSSKRASRFRIKKISNQEKIRKYLLMEPNRGCDTKIDWSTDRRS